MTEATMQFEKPPVQRVYVTLTDGQTRKSEHVTVYNATPQQILDRLKSQQDVGPMRSRRKRPQHAVPPSA